MVKSGLNVRRFGTITAFEHFVNQPRDPKGSLGQDAKSTRTCRRYGWVLEGMLLQHSFLTHFSRPQFQSCLQTIDNCHKVPRRPPGTHKASYELTSLTLGLAVCAGAARAVKSFYEYQI